jgi:hypothetical protein
VDDERPRYEHDSRFEALARADEDAKGWGRATIRFLTHPLHPFPKVSSADFLLPYRPDPLRLAGDCVVAGLAFAALAFFPLLLVALATPHQLGSWFWPSIALTGLAGGIYVFCRAWSPDTRDLDRF